MYFIGATKQNLITLYHDPMMDWGQPEMIRMRLRLAETIINNSDATTEEKQFYREEYKRIETQRKQHIDYRSGVDKIRREIQSTRSQLKLYRRARKEFEKIAPLYPKIKRFLDNLEESARGVQVKTIYEPIDDIELFGDYLCHECMVKRLTDGGLFQSFIDLAIAPAETESPEPIFCGECGTLLDAILPMDDVADEVWELYSSPRLEGWTIPLTPMGCYILYHQIFKHEAEILQNHAIPGLIDRQVFLWRFLSDLADTCVCPNEIPLRDTFYRVTAILEMFWESVAWKVEKFKRWFK